MGYPEELLDSAISLFQLTPQTQANLRRAVSSCYYALFHLLIEETCNNWARPEQRTRLSRRFEHARMLEASRRSVEMYRKAAEGSSEKHLFTVAHAFFQLQEKRHTADYDLARNFQDTEVSLDIFLAQNAFHSWRIIRSQQISQDYLFSLLFRDKS
jgi:uncharacterized protein (UPF0332 family)